jgi:hypothetical protein
VRTACLLVSLALISGLSLAATPSSLPSDIPGKFTVDTDSFDYIKREVMIPMRDGVKLKTYILVPKRASKAPMLMTRTPYNAEERVLHFNSPHLAAAVPQMDDTAVAAGYIIVFQDVRGKYGSEGDYVMTRPPKGPLNPTEVDHATDTYDTIDWLVKNVPESNGKVGMIGGSYEGFTVVMGTMHPHPALKVAVPFAPMVDTWIARIFLRPGGDSQRRPDVVERHPRHLSGLPRSRLGRGDGGVAWRGSAGLLESPVAAPGLRPLLAASGGRQDHGG